MKTSGCCAQFTQTHPDAQSRVWYFLALYTYAVFCHLTLAVLFLLEPCHFYFKTKQQLKKCKKKSLQINTVNNEKTIHY